MSKISYYQIPLGYNRRIDKRITSQLGLTPSTLGRKKFYRGENILIKIDENIATVMYDKLAFSDEAVSKLFSKHETV